ncbi:MAG: SIR2 family protein, partial [Actinobacteria bacterium]|nr:SIR2 family protein [Actinomycetota bacterium]
AHQYLAGLCHSGKVQVVITTNFDRLIEQALSTLGVHFQVVNQDNVTGMMPLVRGLTTVFKVNGDYLSLGMKNTSLELTKYTRTLATRLREVVRDFGLIVVGWSGQWDTALRELLQTNPARNYPMYWVAHQGQISDDAQRLIDNRGAYQIDSSGADEFFTQVVSRLDRLDQLSRQRRSTRRALRYDGIYGPSQRNAVTSMPSRDIWIRTAVELGPTSLEETGYIDPPERQAILVALHRAEITKDLMNLSIMGAATTSVPLETWATSPVWEISHEDHLTRDTVGFRLHSQGNRCGLTARSWFQTPEYGSGDNLLGIFDVGVGRLTDRVNSPRKLSLAELAYLLLNQFAVQAEILSQTLYHLTAETANLRKVEYHLYVPPTQDNSPGGNVSDYIDLSSLGSDGRESRQMSVAFPLSEPLTRQDQFEIVIEALRHIALSSGYAQPDNGITTLRKVLAHKFGS